MKQYTQQPSLLALSPLFIFLGVYLVTSLIVDDFYKVPITVAFVISSIAAIAMTRHLGLSERIAHFSGGASDKNILLMIWIFIRLICLLPIKLQLLMPLSKLKKTCIYR